MHISSVENPRGRFFKVEFLLSVEPPPALRPALLKLALPRTLLHLIELLTARHRLQRAQDIASRTSPAKFTTELSVNEKSKTLYILNMFASQDALEVM